ncbi:MAG: glycosyltransferase [Candidatus Caldatribacteriota bacterium]|nr:glycosyltransferase [Candidatus Caldatribacteriota bacterium]
MNDIEDYREIIGDETYHNLFKKARRLSTKTILNINSTAQGGGVAEILESLVILMNELGIYAGWRILHGNPDFFTITKKFHNALQGSPINFSKIKKKIYLKTNEEFSIFTHIDHDAVIVHDPQPLPLIKYYKKSQPWIWRCHIDLSTPNPKLWHSLKNYVLRYDRIIVSSEKYVNKELPVPQKVIAPAINPISPKNKELIKEDIEKYRKKYKIPHDKPIITQVSRFDRAKDPLGVIKVFKKVKSKIDCRLILCGSMSVDDPEGIKIYEQVVKRNQKLIDNKDIIILNVENDILVNVLQRISSVIIQKSLKEGFGLTITEALWKETPVVASNVGGIPLQITDGVSGYLLEPFDYDGFAERIIYLLENPSKAEEIGKKAKETVRRKFLITRLLEDYIDLLNELI